MSYKVKIEDVKSKSAAIVEQRLKENDGFCPCKLGKSADTKCMCKAFREQTTPGPCHCGLYEKQLEEV